MGSVKTFALAAVIFAVTIHTCICNPDAEAEPDAEAKPQQRHWHRNPWYRQEHHQQQHWQPPFRGPQQPYFQDRNLYRTGWIPIKNPEKLNLRPNVDRLPVFGNKPFTDSQVLAYLQRYYPQLFEAAASASAPGPPPMLPQPQRPPGPWAPNNWWDRYYGSQYLYNYGPPIQEVVASCDRRYCYKACRLMLVGGGRCTKAGCMCYHNFFDFEGRPMQNLYPEDLIWYELTQFEQQRILDAERSGETKRPPPTKPPHQRRPRPTRPSWGDEDTHRPHFRPTTTEDYNWFDNFKTTTTSRPGWFQRTTSTSRPHFHRTTTTDDNNWFFDRRTTSTSRPDFGVGGGGGWHAETDRPPFGKEEDTDNTDWFSGGDIFDDGDGGGDDDWDFNKV